MPTSRSQLQARLVHGFLRDDIGSRQKLVDHLTRLGEEELAAEVSSSATCPEDRLAIAFRLLPSETVIRLACSFIEHALTSPIKNRNRDEATSGSTPNKKALQLLTAYVGGRRDDPEATDQVQSWAKGGGHLPRPDPGIRAAAKGAVDPPKASQHCLKATEEARHYYAWHRAGYQDGTEEYRQAERRELKWQVKHAITVLAVESGVQTTERLMCAVSIVLFAGVFGGLLLSGGLTYLLLGVVFLLYSTGFYFCLAATIESPTNRRIAIIVFFVFYAYGGIRILPLIFADFFAP